MSAVTLGQARAVVRDQLTGSIMQVPPMVSALKVDGRRLHELAREGIEIERAPRPVTVYRFELEPTGDPGVFRAEVECSSGTYIRSLAADLGHLLGGGAHLRNLRRTKVGPFTLAEAHPPEAAELLAPIEALRGHTRVEVDDETAALVRTGRVFAAFDGPPPWALVDRRGELLAVYEPFRSDQAKPTVVVAGVFDQ
jgi:tRNA pseudouridine55 synthase